MTEFIDFHVHPPVAEFLDGPMVPHIAAIETHLGVELKAMAPDELADTYRSRGGRAVLLGWDSEALTGHRPLSSADIAGLVNRDPDVFFGLGAVDPAKGARAVGDVHSAARLGLAGVSVHPVAQGFDPADHTTFPIWETAAEHRLICMFHTGLTELGAGTRGGGGLRLGHGRPMAVDLVAARFPELSVVIAHSGSMWRDEAVAVAGHKANVWLSVTGEPSRDKHEAPEVTIAALPDRCLFGSDFPFGSIDARLESIGGLPIDDSTRRRVLRDNAAELLGVDPA